MNEENFLWVERYRPQTIDDAILPDSLKKIFQSCIDNREIPNMTLVGHAGVGKTTIAKVMLKQLDCDYIVINGSLNLGIDVLRTKILDFATAATLKSTKKYIIIDEADGLTELVQRALRSFIEEHSAYCGFILTCNFKNKMIDAIQSRCPIIEFSVSDKDKLKLAGRFLKRTFKILDENKIIYRPEIVAEVVQKYSPDWREILGTLQFYSKTGTLEENVLGVVGGAELEKLIDFMKSKDYTALRTWVGENVSIDSASFFDGIFALCEKYMTVAGRAQTVMILANYQYQAAFAASQEINNLACMVEIMVQDGVWK